MDIVHTALRMTLRCLEAVMRKIAMVLVVTGHFQILLIGLPLEAELQSRGAPGHSTDGPAW
jgi:hypothetical protein